MSSYSNDSTGSIIVCLGGVIGCFKLEICKIAEGWIMILFKDMQSFRDFIIFHPLAEHVGTRWTTPAYPQTLPQHKLGCSPLAQLAQVGMAWFIFTNGCPIFENKTPKVGWFASWFAWFSLCLGEKKRRPTGLKFRFFPLKNMVHRTRIRVSRPWAAPMVACGSWVGGPTILAGQVGHVATNEVAIPKTSKPFKATSSWGFIIIIHDYPMLYHPFVVRLGVVYYWV